MTTDHLRPLLPDHRGLHLLFQISERLARAEVPEAVVNIIRMGEAHSTVQTIWRSEGYCCRGCGEAIGGTDHVATAQPCS